METEPRVVKLLDHKKKGLLQRLLFSRLGLIVVMILLQILLFLSFFTWFHQYLTHYEVLLEYLGWTDAGRVIAPGVWPAGSVSSTPYPHKAYELGRSL